MTDKEIRAQKKLLKKAFFRGNCMARNLMDKKLIQLTRDFNFWYNQNKK